MFMIIMSISLKHITEGSWQILLNVLLEEDREYLSKICNLLAEELSVKAC